MAAKDLPPAEVLRQLFGYDPGSGKLTWKLRAREWFPSDRIHKSWNGRHAGKEAFTNVDDYGYRRGRLLGNTVRAHTVIWTLVHGEPPNGVIDHINHDRTDNRISNLRVVSKRENHLNSGMNRSNTSGVTGVVICKKRWQASITVNHETIYLGRFDRIEDAAAARLAAERKYGFHKNHGK